ncbi:MAG: hypothetical protein RLZZ381_2514 [Cyanobacteriota bacterium]|jgi:hypothetical protein
MAIAFGKRYLTQLLTQNYNLFIMLDLFKVRSPRSRYRL